MPAIARAAPVVARSMPAIVVALVAWSTSVGATTYEATPETYGDLVRRLRAGDTLALSGGEYRDGLALHDLAGEADRPITIAGPADGRPATFVARAGRNTVSIVDSHHVVLRNLVLDGRGLPVDAVKSERQSRYAHHITLENLLIRGHGNNQQTVGISTKCPAWNWVIRGNTIVGAGTGMYLGDSDGSAPFVAGIIERNLIVDTIGYNLQIKHQHVRPVIAGMPGGASVTVIRHNVFANPGGGSQSAPRPNVLVGHFPPDGAGVDDRYAVYGNFFYRNRYEALFQGEGNVALYANLFVNPDGDAIHVQPHNDIPKRIDIAFNTVLAGRVGISVVASERSLAYAQTVTANAVFAAVPIVGGAEYGNFTGPYADADRHLNRPFAAPGELDLFPRRRWTPAALADPPNPLGFPDWDRDFNGRPRKPGAIGAYGDSGANPGRLPALTTMPD
jgi:hypothetical protein